MPLATIQCCLKLWLFSIPKSSAPIISRFFATAVAFSSGVSSGSSSSISSSLSSSPSGFSSSISSLTPLITPSSSNCLFKHSALVYAASDSKRAPSTSMGGGPKSMLPPIDPIARSATWMANSIWPTLHASRLILHISITMHLILATAISYSLLGLWSLICGPALPSATISTSFTVAGAWHGKGCNALSEPMTRAGGENVRLNDSNCRPPSGVSAINS
mmetsp:Transcript_30621/g.53862  ORF Transcript_30621/g.53862 Transcript_30621/m.53862 type:complete len:218 (+) Transcript_30621:612-1265(+)